MIRVGVPTSCCPQVLEFAEFLVLLGDIQYCKLFQPSDWQEILDTENATQLVGTKKEAQHALDDKSPSQQKLDAKKAAYKAKVPCCIFKRPPWLCKQHTQYLSCSVVKSAHEQLS